MVRTVDPRSRSDMYTVYSLRLIPVSSTVTATSLIWHDLPSCTASDDDAIVV
jgi:hypothetical protein